MWKDDWYNTMIFIQIQPLRVKLDDSRKVMIIEIGTTQIPLLFSTKQRLYKVDVLYESEKIFF